MKPAAVPFGPTRSRNVAGRTTLSVGVRSLADDVYQCQKKGPLRRESLPSYSMMAARSSHRKRIRGRLPQNQTTGATKKNGR
jgi:hypothetical protein